MDDLITAPEAARILEVTAETLRKWRNDGRGPSVMRVGPRAHLYRRAEVEAFKATRQAPTRH